MPQYMGVFVCVCMYFDTHNTFMDVYLWAHIFARGPRFPDNRTMSETLLFKDVVSLGNPLCFHPGGLVYHM